LRWRQDIDEGVLVDLPDEPGGRVGRGCGSPLAADRPADPEPDQAGNEQDAENANECLSHFATPLLGSRRVPYVAILAYSRARGHP
jgi:hypothetical protein